LRNLREVLSLKPKRGASEEGVGGNTRRHYQGRGRGNGLGAGELAGGGRGRGNIYGRGSGLEKVGNIEID
jgi:hypothetical protein